MRAFVLADPALASQAGRFVWLELNTDLTANAAVLEKHEADALPTYLVVDPRDESVVLRWTGSFTVPQAEAFLQEARDKMAGATPPATPADAALARADHLYGTRDYKAAADAYREALAQAPAGWPRYNRAVEALLFSCQQTDAYATAIALAREALPRVGGTPSAIVVSLGGLDSALSLPKGDAGRAATIAEMEAAVRKALADPAVHAAADDRSGAYLSLMQARKDAGDAEGAKKVASELAAFLEGEAAKARTPDERAVFDSHRLSAYLELGHPEKAVAMLQQSAKDLPGDYNPHNRLARAYAAMKRWDDALAASRKAAALATGRAKLRVLSTRASLMQEKGDKPSAAAAYDEAIAYAESLPEGERPAKQIESLKKQRDRLKAAPSS
jgi:tetratricopeptide (TPR) repeat protein